MPFYTEPVPFNFHVYSGFREDNLKFRIGSENRLQDIDTVIDHHRKKVKTHSVGKWRNLKIAAIGASMNWTTHNEYYIRATADYGRIIEGEGRVENYKAREHCGDASSSGSGSDFDSSSFSSSSSSSSSCSSSESYASHRREYSKQSSESDNGYVTDLLGGVGWKVVSFDGRTWVAGVGGYSFHRQSLEMKNFEQEKDFFDILGAGAKITGLKGTYLTSWTGPWLGVDFLTKVEYDVTMYGSFEWHWAKYRASGHWTYIDEYQAHIRHNSHGYGAVGRLGVDWTPCEAWAFGVCGDYQIWSTKSEGKNRASVNNNIPAWDLIPLTFPVVKRSSLRRVKWNSYSISALVSYRF